MRGQISVLSCVMLFSCGALCRGQQALRSTVRIPTAGVRGRVTIDEVVGHAVQSNPIPKLKLYLLRVDDTRPLVQLQESCRRATADPHADPLRAYRTCSQNLRSAVALVPTLPSVATAETDRDGGYEFAAVPASGRYHVVGVKMVEGGEPIVMVGIVECTKSLEQIRQ